MRKLYLVEVAKKTLNVNGLTLELNEGLWYAPVYESRELAEKAFPGMAINEIDASGCDHPDCNNFGNYNVQGVMLCSVHVADLNIEGGE